MLSRGTRRNMDEQGKETIRILNRRVMSSVSLDSRVLDVAVIGWKFIQDKITEVLKFQSEEWSLFNTQRFWRQQWRPTPVFLPGEFHGQRSLAGDCPWGHKELDMTENIHAVLFWVLSHFSCVQLFETPIDCRLPGPLSMGFSRQEYWSGLTLSSQRTKNLWMPKSPIFEAF